MKPSNAKAVLERIEQRKQLASRLKAAYTRSGYYAAIVTIDGMEFERRRDLDFVPRLRTWLDSEIARLERLIKRDERRVAKWR